MTLQESGMSTADAFKTIKKKKLSFLSEVTTLEQIKRDFMWEKVSQITPEKDTWYIQTGQGMLTTINMASEKGGYTLTDKLLGLNMKHKKVPQII